MNDRDVVIWITLDCGCTLGFHSWIGDLIDGTYPCPVHEKHGIITDHYWVTDKLVARPCQCCKSSQASDAPPACIFVP